MNNFFTESIAPTSASPEQRAIITLLVLTMEADGFAAPEEQFEINVLGVRSHSLHQLAAEEFEAEWRRAGAAMNKYGPNAAADEALAALREDRRFRLAVYAHCLDVAYADRNVAVSERAFLQRLAERFDLPTTEAGRVAEVMRIKNDA